MEDDQGKEMLEKLKFKLGVSGAMASHAMTTAGLLKQSADHHSTQTNVDLSHLRQQIEQSGVGNDEEAENEYGQKLMERRHLGQAYELAEKDETRFPDVIPHDQHLSKSLHRLPPEAIDQPYTWGKVSLTGAFDPDDYQPRLYDPQELLAREPERDKDPAKITYFKDIFNQQDPHDIDPVVLIRTEHGREIIDGHHRALGAREAGRPLRAVEMSQETFERLCSLGFTEMDAAYALLAMGDCWEAAEAVKSQYDGKPVWRTGYLAYERLKVGNFDVARPD